MNNMLADIIRIEKKHINEYEKYFLKRDDTLSFE